MIIYLYRWKLKPGKEADFADAWAIVTKELKAKCSSLGSRLHLGGDGLFYGYAQWPDKKTREEAKLSGDRIEDARRRMRDATAESLPEIVLEPQADFLRAAIPIIDTPRLTLRSHRLEDFAACCAMWADPNVTRYISGKPSTPQQTWARLLNYAGHWALMGFGYWAVEEKSSGKFIGELGFADFKREMTPSISDFPELGWAFASEFHGKGYASEALQYVTAWADTHLSGKKVVCIINPENRKSITIAERLGFKLLTRTAYNDQPINLFSRSNKEDIRDPRFSFRRITNDDLTLLHDWLKRPHVAERWDCTMDLPTVQKKYQVHISSQNVFGYLALLHGSPVGYVQSYDATSVGDGWWPDAKPGTWGIDQFLASEEDLGKGLGTELVRQFSEFVFEVHNASNIITDPAPENKRAIRCYEKAGFAVQGRVNTPDGPAILMEKNKPQKTQLTSRTFLSPFREKFGEHGYIVFPQIVPQEYVEAAVDAVCRFARVQLSAPTTWYELPAENGGVVPLHHAQELWDIRQHPNVYEAFKKVYGHGRLWVSMDRAGFRPPMKEGLEAPQEDGWHRSLGNIHWDAPPNKPHPGLLQGVLLLSDTSQNSGGFQCVPGIYRDLEKWLERHPNFNPDKPDLSEEKIIQVEGKAGDLIIWDPFLPHGPGHNFSNRPRIAQYITMVPLPTDEEAIEKERKNRIQLFQDKRAPEWWRGLAGQHDPEPGPQVQLTPLGKKLVGVDLWD